MKNEVFYRSFLLALLLAVLWLFWLLIEPFFTPILGAIFLVIMVHPLHVRMTRLWPRASPNFHAISSTLVSLIVIVVPFLTACWLLVNESQQLLPSLQNAVKTLQSWREGTSWMNLRPVQMLRYHLPNFMDFTSDDVQRIISQGVTAAVTAISVAGRAVATNAVLSAINLVLLFFTVFYLFRDGEAFVGKIKRLIPMQTRDKDRLLLKLKTTILGIVRGSILTALFQMVSATAAYLIVNAPAAIILGMATGIASFIPVIGTALVWAPVGVLYLLKGVYWKGIFILAWGGFVVATLDHFLRTWLIGKRTKLPVLFLLFAILGGGKLYGIRGLLFAPLVVAILPILFELYAAAYLPGHD